MIKKMGKVQIIGPKALLEECIRTLHALSMIHIETVPTEGVSGEEEEFIKRLPIEREKVREKLYLERARERVKTLLALLKKPARLKPEDVLYEELQGLLEELRPLEDEVRELSGERGELEDEFKSIERYERVLRVFAPMVTKLGGLKNFDIVGLTIDKVKRDVIGLLEGEVKAITGGKYVIYKRSVDETTVGVLLACQREYSAAVRALLSDEAINEVRLPEEYREVSFLTALSKMVVKKEELPEAIAKVEGRLREISLARYGSIEAIKRAVEDALEEIGTLDFCAETRHCFLIEGWVPEDLMERFATELNRLFVGKVFIREIEFREEEEDIVPVYIKNPKWLRPFEIFLKFLPTPRYRSVDPTPWMALFFPAFFGLIVGDVGYGLILLIAGFFLARRFRDREVISDLFQVLCVSALTAIIFGVVFGEFFGDLGERLGISIFHDPLFDRMRGLKVFLTLSLGVGIGHVSLGFIIAVVNYINRGRVKKAVHKATMFFLLVSFLVIVGIILEKIPKNLLTPGVGVFIVFFILLVAMEGVFGIAEFMKTVSHVLSYVRIMAVGTASVVMALVANEAGGMAGSLLAGVLVATALHALNIMLCVLTPAIQSLRLQYVEFLSKFYEGGGRKYAPFKKK